MKTILTLTFIFDGGRVLLGRKKRGFGAGRINGFGGKVKPGESLIQGAKREIMEEAGVAVDALQKMAVLTFTFERDPDKLLEVHVWRTEIWSGQPIETDEMIPAWYALTDIPIAQFWDADKVWFPLFLENKKLTAHFHYDHEERLLSHEINLVNEL